MAENETPDPSIRFVNDIMIIEPPNELFDRLEIANVGDAWLAVIEARKPQRVIINFDQVRFFGSEAIGLLIRIAKRVRSWDGDVKLCSMGKVIREIFDICNLIPALFQVYGSTADAIASFEP